jgi:hypothetical protein
MFRMSTILILKKYLKDQAALIRATKKDYQNANAGHDVGRFLFLKIYHRIIGTTILPIPY